MLTFKCYAIDVDRFLELSFGSRRRSAIEDLIFYILLTDFLRSIYTLNQENLDFKGEKVGSTYTPVRLIHRKIR